MTVTNLHQAFDRIPPQNLEAEMALIGSVLVDKEIMGVIGEIIRPSDFYALVRVEAVEKGDNCTVSWRLIPTPEGDSKLAAK